MRRKIVLGKFEVFENGDVYNLERRTKKGRLVKRKKIIAGKPPECRIKLQCEDETVSFSHQRLIYSCFVGEIPKNKVVFNIDGNLKNNSISNLAIRPINRNPYRDPVKISKAQLKNVIKRIESGEMLTNIAKDYNVSLSLISRIKSKQRRCR